MCVCVCVCVFNVCVRRGGACARMSFHGTAAAARKAHSQVARWIPTPSWLPSLVLVLVLRLVLPGSRPRVGVGGPRRREHAGASVCVCVYAFVRWCPREDDDVAAREEACVVVGMMERSVRRWLGAFKSFGWMVSYAQGCRARARIAEAACWPMHAWGRFPSFSAKGSPRVALEDGGGRRGLRCVHSTGHKDGAMP